MIKYYIVIGIIYMIPYMVMIGISCLKDKLETDRNFYGKDINPKEIKLINVSYEKLKIERKKFEKCTEMGQIKYIYTQNFGYEQLILSEEEYNKYFPDMFVDTAIAYFIIYKFAYDSPKGMLEAETKLIKPTMEKIELTNVSYKKFEIARNNIKKYTEMGEIKYVYNRSYDFEDERLLLSEKEYQKCFPDKFVKTTVAYYIIFEFSYETDHGKIKAKITLTKPVIEKTYNDKDVEEIKKLIYEECSNKIFANVGTESKYKDYKGQEVIHSLPIRTSTLEGEIIGESNKRPGQYDWMFSDSSWYPEEAKKRNRFLSFCTYLNPNKRNSIFLPYFTIGILGIIINWMFNLIIK